MLRRRSRGVAQFSQHMLGKAIDFHIPGVSVEELRAAGMRLQRGGVGFYPGSFVHVDVGSVRHWPRMTHDQLARVFPDGRTVHVPSNGQPLARLCARARRHREARLVRPSGMSLAAARNSGAIGDERARRLGGEAEEGRHPVAGCSASRPTRKRTTRSPSAGAGDPRRGGRHQAGCGSAHSAAAGAPGRDRARTPAHRRSRAGGFALASATSTPFSLPVAHRAAPAGRGHRADRSQRLAPETTASITSWLNDAEFARTDRVPPGMALAYAAQAAPDGQRARSR